MNRCKDQPSLIKQKPSIGKNSAADKNTFACEQPILEIERAILFQSLKIVIFCSFCQKKFIVISDEKFCKIIEVKETNKIACRFIWSSLKIDGAIISLKIQILHFPKFLSHIILLPFNFQIGPHGHQSGMKDGPNSRGRFILNQRCTVGNFRPPPPPQMRMELRC